VAWIDFTPPRVNQNKSRLEKQGAEVTLSETIGEKLSRKKLNCKKAVQLKAVVKLNLWEQKVALVLSKLLTIMSPVLECNTVLKLNTLTVHFMFRRQEVVIEVGRKLLYNEYTLKDKVFYSSFVSK